MNGLFLLLKKLSKCFSAVGSQFLNKKSFFKKFIVFDSDTLKSGTFIKDGIKELDS